jgi:hypothetical protein
VEPAITMTELRDQDADPGDHDAVERVITMAWRAHTAHDPPTLLQAVAPETVAGDARASTN